MSICEINNGAKPPQTTVILMLSDQSAIKGLFWGLNAMGFGTGAAALGTVTCFTFTNPLVFSAPATLVLCGMSALIASYGALVCAKNSMYHLGSQRGAFPFSG